MIEKIGNMWDYKSDIYLVTTNATITNKGDNYSLVMGRGAALEAKRKFAHCNKEFAKLILKSICLTQLHINLHIGYGVILSEKYSNLGIFQVKYEYNDRAKLELISFSTNILLKLLEDRLKNKSISLNFPGIGNGKLRKDNVIDIIKVLPDNVMLWSKEEKKDEG